MTKWLICFIVLLFFISGCAMQGAEKEKVVQIGTSSRAIDYAPYYVARHNGWFEQAASKYGATVTYAEFQSIASINEAFGSGKVDIVFEAGPPAIVGKAAGMDTKIRGLGVTLTQEILVRRDSGINSIQDFKGKKIAVPFGSSSHYGLMKILKPDFASFC